MDNIQYADDLVEKARSHLLSNEERSKMMEDAIRSSHHFGLHGMMTIIAFVCARDLLTQRVVAELKNYFSNHLEDRDLIESYKSVFAKNIRISQSEPLINLLEWLNNFDEVEEN